MSYRLYELHVTWVIVRIMWHRLYHIAYTSHSSCLRMRLYWDSEVGNIGPETYEFGNFGVTQSKKFLAMCPVDEPPRRPVNPFLILSMLYLSRFTRLELVFWCFSIIWLNLTVANVLIFLFWALRALQTRKFYPNHRIYRWPRDNNYWILLPNQDNTTDFEVLSTTRATKYRNAPFISIGMNSLYLKWSKSILVLIICPTWLPISGTITITLLISNWRI